jgi:di/tricarboxylate transporter
LTTGHLSVEASRLSAILVGVLVLWITESLPLPVTALLGAALCVVLGVADAKTVLSPFANPVVFLFIGSFVLARAMTEHGLDRRIALKILGSQWVGGKPRARAVCDGDCDKCAFDVGEQHGDDGDDVADCVGDFECDAVTEAD